MKLTGIFVGIAVVAIIAVMVLVAVSPAEQPAVDVGEVLTGAGDLVEAITGNNAEFVRTVYVWSTWANSVYLVQTMPYTVMAVAGAVLALGLGLVLVVVMGGGRHGV